MRPFLQSLTAVALTVAASAALAAGDAPRPAVHELWVSHLLAACIAALLGALAARSAAMAGIVLCAAIAYAAGRAFGSAPAPDVSAYYPFHVQATALLIPLAVLGGFFARRTSLLYKT